MKRQHEERTMHIGDWITGFGFIAMLTFALGLDSNNWGIYLILVITSFLIMAFGQAIKKVRWAATRLRTKKNKYFVIIVRRG